MMTTNRQGERYDAKLLFSFNRAALDIVDLVAGVGLLISSWLLGFTAVSYAAWNSWLVGAAIALIAVAALCALSEGEEWVNL
jgi:phosphoglycerol transferase MdoB-like AlkP superfamily enzyme